MAPSRTRRVKPKGQTPRKDKQPKQAEKPVVKTRVSRTRKPSVSEAKPAPAPTRRSSRLEQLREKEPLSPHTVPRGKRKRPNAGDNREPFLPDPSSKRRRVSPPREPLSPATPEKPVLVRAPLTRKNLSRLENMVRKQQQGTGRSRSTAGQSTSKDTTSKTKTTSTTASGFAMQAYMNGVLPPNLSSAPENLEAIQKRYDQPRDTASPTQSEYEDYVARMSRSGNEATAVLESAPALLKKYPASDNYMRSFNRAFTGFPKDVGFNNGLSAAQPDFVEGLCFPEYNRCPVQDYVPGAVLYNDDVESITLPHIAGEWKTSGKEMGRAALQSGYDGASLVYARQQALSYMEKPDPPGTAQVATFTTDGDTLNLFAHYSRPTADDSSTEYHQYPVSRMSLTASHEEHKKGRRALRNAQDYAREQSYAMRDDLTGYWKGRKDRRDQKDGVPESAKVVADTGLVGGTTVEADGAYAAEEEDEVPTEEEVRKKPQEHDRAPERGRRGRKRHASLHTPMPPPERKSSRIRHKVKE